MVESPEPAPPLFISEWPGVGRAKLVLREKRLLQLIGASSYFIIFPILLWSALSTLRGRVPGLPESLTGGLFAETVGCVAILVGILIALVALVFLQRVRRESGSRGCTALYLRPMDDEASRRVLENALYNLVGSRIRLLQLADRASNVTPQFGVVVRFVVSVLSSTFLLLTLETMQLIPRPPDIVVTALGMVTAAIVELGYRKVKRSSRRRGAVGTLEELEREVRRARSWIAKGKTLRKSTITIASSVAVWTHAIRQLAPLADAILLDVSRPGVGLAWELSYCLATRPNRLLVLGRETDIRDWLRARSPETPHIARMKELLSGRPILAYDRAAKDFPQALLAALLDVCERGEDLEPLEASSLP